MPVDTTKLFVDYQYLLTLWGDLKLHRLIKAENPDDLPANIDRLNVAIDAVQNELLGYFGHSFDSAGTSVSGYVKGIIPPFLEYRLNPTDSLKYQIDMLFKNMETIKMGVIEAESKPDFSMFVV